MSLTLTLERGGGEVSGSGTNIELDGTIAGGAIESVEMYGDTQQTTYSGKNLFNSFEITSSTGSVTKTVDENGVIYLSNNSYNNGYCPTGITLATFAPSLVAGQSYYIYVDNDFGDGGRNYIYLSGSGTFWNSGSAHTVTQAELNGGVVVYGGYQATTSLVVMITVAEDSNYEKYVGGTASPNPDYPQEVQTVTGEQTITISDGQGQSQSYSVNLGDIELCKIGTYQDYIYKSGDDWYLHSEIEKQAMGSLTWNPASTGTSGVYRMYSDGIRSSVVIPATGSEIAKIVCSHYTPETAANTWSTIVGVAVQTTDGRLFVYDSNYNTNTSQSAFTTWLINNNVELYYALSTPTDTQITDVTLIAQLDALNEATTYDGTTIITVSSENLASPLEVTAAASIAKTYTEVEIGSPFTITDVEGKSSNTTLDGNVYVDWAYNKKQYSFDLFNLTPQDYADIRAFYDYQFNNSAFPTITVPELNIDRLPVYMEISSRNIINQCLLTDKLTIKFRETVQP